MKPDLHTKIEQRIVHLCCGRKPIAAGEAGVDIRPHTDTQAGLFVQMDALDFLKSLSNYSRAGLLFDQPYSLEQCLRIYTPKQNGTAGRAEYWARCKDEIARIVKLGGIVVSFCWDSTGIGKKRGFEILEILLLCHGACHNDTIVTVEKAVSNQSKQESFFTQTEPTQIGTKGE